MVISESCLSWLDSYWEGWRLRKLVSVTWVNVAAREPPWEQNGLPPMVNIMRIASATSRCMRGASHQPAFMSSCLTFSEMCLSCLPSSIRVIPCVLWPYVIGLMVILLTFLSHGEYGVTYGVVTLFQGIGMEFQDKIMLYCFREVKCKQDFTTGIWY